MGTELQWYMVNDTVMGGRSSASAEATPEGLAFRGTINTRGGGFASVRSSGGDLGSILAGAEGVSIRCRGDGMRYMVTCRTGSDEGFAYCHDVLAQGDVEVLLPFNKFIPSMRGQPMQAEPLRGENIRSVGIVLSLRSMNGAQNREFGDGPFEFLLRDLSPAGQAQAGPALGEPMQIRGDSDSARIQDAISKGAPSWNAGNKAQTVKLYMQVCRDAADPSLRDAAGHVEQFRCDAESAGWVLRCAMDEVLEPPGKGNWAVSQAIKKGVPFFNSGMPAVCASVYMRAGTRHDDPLMQGALLEAKKQSDPTAAAWAMRRAFDLVLKDSLIGG